MKKILALCLALTMALAVFAGCSGAASSSAPAAGSASGSASTGGSATGKQLSGKVVYWSMYNEGEPEAMAIQKAADMFMEDYPDCEVEIQWIGRSNQDITGPALEGGEQLDILDNFSYDKSTDRYLDITDMMNEPALGQEDMTVAESILPVLNLANAQGQEKAGLETDKYYGVQMFPWVVGFFYNKDLFQQAGITETPETWTEFMEACQKLKDAGLDLVTRQPETAVTILADGRRLWRVFDNLMNNICKYAQRGTRVYLTLEERDGQAVISFKNTSRAPLDIPAEELLERFVRGDAARGGEGNGLGLSIARSLTELQKGTLELTVDGDLFKVVLRFSELS